VSCTTSNLLGSFYRTADRTVDQFNVSHRSVVTSAETALKDAQVAAVTGGVALAQIVEQLAHDGFRTGTVEGQTTIGNAVFLGLGDQRLGNATQLLGFRQGSFDQLVLEQRDRHVLEHGLAVSAGAAEVTATFTMTHGSIPYQTCSFGDDDDQAVALSSFFRLAGGQLSRRIPRDRPREARTSVISVRDFLPRFGVLSSSTSVR